jgi:hypothetical protein
MSTTPYWQILEPSGRPYWQMLDGPPRPTWQLTEPRKRPPRELKREIYRAAPVALELIERSDAAAPVLEMLFAPFGVWQEIRDASGRYLERIQRGAFAKSVRESLGNVRAVLSHGRDPSLGATVLGTITEIREEPAGAIARVSLFSSVPQLLIDGLRADPPVYGASWRGTPIKNRFNDRPRRSSWNPDGIPEVTRLEVKLADVGPTPFAQYPQTTAMISS